MPKGECAGCGAEPGEFHRLGCQQECCPVCRHLFIRCDCPVSLLEGMGRLRVQEAPGGCQVGWMPV